MEGVRGYFGGDTYCCPCNFRRIIAELPGLIYYHRDNGVAINLYTESSTMMKLDCDVSLAVRQETDYLNSGKVIVHLELSESVRFPLQLRIPRWCPEARVTIGDDQTTMTAAGGSFCTMTRLWKAGDYVTLNMPMPWRAIRGLRSQDGRAAIMRGPVLFCLNPDRQSGLDAETSKLLRLDPASPTLGSLDSNIRPSGLTCQAFVWRPSDYNAAGTANLPLTLTEYADPGCQWTYFLVPNPETNTLNEDELTSCALSF